MKFHALRWSLLLCAFFAFSSSFAHKTASGPVREPASALADQQVTHLALLGQVWGYLKYYHPGVAKGKLDWDAELFKILPAVKKATDDEAFSELLLQWIDGLGKVPGCPTCTAEVPKGLITDNIDLAWMKDKHFSAALQERLNYLLVNRNTAPGYYAKFDKGILSFAAQRIYNGQTGFYENEHFRLLGLFRYWNIIQYFSPNKYLTGRNWNEVLYEYVPKVSDATDAASYHLAMKGLVSNVHDTHANYYVP